MIGVEGDEFYWVMREGIPILVSRDMMRPIDTAEALAYLHMYPGKHGRFEPAEGAQQQGHNSKISQTARLELEFYRIPIEFYRSL